MNDLDNAIPQQLRDAIAKFGFAKVAAQMYGVPEINEKTASVIVGTGLMTRLAEERQIQTGLTALAELEKSALLGLDDAVGAAVGYRYGKKQKERDEEHTFGAKQVASLLLPGGLGYQAGRGAAHAMDHKKSDSKKKDKE